MIEKNCNIFNKLLETKGFKFHKIFHAEDLIHGQKDLRVVSKHLKIPVENIVLVDDSPKKSV